MTKFECVVIVIQSNVNKREFKGAKYHSRLWRLLTNSSFLLMQAHGYSLSLIEVRSNNNPDKK